MQTRKLSNEIHLQGLPYFPGWWTQIDISPSKYHGITINGLILSPDSLTPMTFLGARFLGLCDPRTWKPIAEVVEHLISACYAAGITKASIRTPSTVPVVGWGIEQIYTTILSNSAASTPLQEPQKLSKNITFYSEDGSCELHVEAWVTLDIKIERKNDPEINANATLHVPDVYTYLHENENARKARPIARLKNPIIHGLQQWIQLLWWKGITTDNYIFNTRTTSTDDIKEQMYPEFQEAWNEHLVHTLVADFFGELHTFFPHGIIWKISLKWKNNHFTRMELLHELYKTI
jgi:hypothetical protein